MDALSKSTFALIIGIGRYQDESIASLKYTGADAEAFAEVLKDADRCGLPEENIKLLVDEQASLLQIKKAISGWLAKAAGEDSTAIIFWAGHGDVEPDPLGRSQDGIANYLLPYDVDRENLFASALSKDEFERLIGAVRSKRRVILMDACHSGGVATVGSRKIGVGYSRDLFDSIAQGTGSVVIAAAEHNQLSWEDDAKGHGVFTHYLLEALKGEADLNNDGRVTMSEIYEYLKKTVPAAVRKLGKGEQRPVLTSRVSGDIVMTINPQRLSDIQEEERKLREAEAARVAGLREELLRMHKEHDLDAEVYSIAHRLVAKPIASMSRSEAKLLPLMEGMFKTPSLVTYFEESCRALQFESTKPKPPIPKPPEPKKPEPTPPEREPKKVESVSKDLNTTMKIGAILFPYIVFFVGFAFMVSSDPARKRAGRTWMILSVVFFVIQIVLLFGLGLLMVLFEGGGYYDPYSTW